MPASAALTAPAVYLSDEPSHTAVETALQALLRTVGLEIVAALDLLDHGQEDPVGTG